MIDGRGDRHLVGGEPLRVVQRGPVGTRGEQFGGLAQRAQRGVDLEVPGVDGLPGEQQRSVPRQGGGGVELREFGAYPLGRPVGRLPPWA